MKRIIYISVSILLILGLIGCSHSASDEQESRVYSFSGGNDLFEVSNGVIVLGEEEEVFDGGDLKILQEELFSDVTSYTCSFYTIKKGEQRTILSNSTVDMTGGTVNVNGDLGKADSTAGRLPFMASFRYNLARRRSSCLRLTKQNSEPSWRSFEKKRV